MQRLVQSLDIVVNSGAMDHLKSFLLVCRVHLCKDIMPCVCGVR